MLTKEARARLSVVLVGARNPQNIGAAARAMQDFGFSDLRVVNTFAPPFEAAKLEATSAVAAGEVMRSARLYSSLSEAIADSTFVVGTTAIGARRLARAVLTLQQASPALRACLESSSGRGQPTGQPTSPEPTTHPCRVALLFGSEKTGLTNEQLSYCSELLTIPMYAPEGRHLSMNLGQSVAVCLYELSREGSEGTRDIPETPVRNASVQARERLFALLLQSMRVSGYERRFPANARTEVVRQLSFQLGRTQNELDTWMGFLRQILRSLSPEEEN